MDPVKIYNPATVILEKLDYDTALQTDKNLQLLMDQLPDSADQSRRELLRYRIDEITLTFCNLTSYTLRVNEAFRSFLDDLLMCHYTKDDCHIVLFQLKEGFPYAKEVRYIDKDDTSEKISRAVFGKFAGGTWGKVPVQWSGTESKPASKEKNFFETKPLPDIPFFGDMLTPATIMEMFYPKDKIEANCLKKINNESSLPEKIFRLEESACLITQQVHSASKGNSCLSPFALLKCFSAVAQNLSILDHEPFISSLGLHSISSEEFERALEVIADEVLAISNNEYRLSIKPNELKDATPVALSTTISFSNSFTMPSFQKLASLQAFKTRNGNVVDIEMMKSSPLELKFLQFERAFSMVEIPLATPHSNDCFCLIFLPGQRGSINSIQNSLNLGFIDCLRKNAEKKVMTVQLPTFELHTHTDNILGPLSEKNEEKILQINPFFLLPNVSEKAFLENIELEMSVNFKADETGEDFSMVASGSDIFSLEVDSPYVFAIMKGQTILAQGTVEDPTILR